jgi:two-component system sensor histidine kinase BaeS
LTNIKGQLEAAESGLITDNPEMISTLRAESRLLERLIDDFQQLAISDAGQLRIHLQTLPVADLLREILSPFIEQSMAKLEFNVPNDLHIVADEERMRQVFGNLMENSIRHHPKQLVIQLAAERCNDFVTIIFSDNGPGVDEQDQDYIFDRFYRAEKSRNRSTGGSGLGLSIVKALVEAMNGSVRYLAHPAAGARFEIRLPAA